MTAGNYTATFEQGADYALVVIVKDANSVVRDLTGYTARMQVRATSDAATSLLELTTANGRITITEASGRLDLSVTAAVTAALTFREAVYDLEIISPTGVVERLIQGRARLSREVTR